jgi:hypothetical protein
MSEILIENRETWEEGVELEVQVEAETTKGICVIAKQHPHAEKKWFPKSYCHLEERGGNHYLFVPLWLLKDRYEEHD